jgi:chromosome segregation ATPase
VQQVEALQAEVLARQAMVQGLQEKFLQSSQHILQETAKGLQDEVKAAYIKARDLELAAEEARGHRQRAELVRTGLTEELGEVRAELARARAELEGEVRTREHRDNRLSLDSQEVTLLREKEQQLRAETGRLQAGAEKQVERLRSAQERLAGEQHQVTGLQLKLSTERSRTAELEGSLGQAAEQGTALRKVGLQQVREGSQA